MDENRPLLWRWSRRLRRVVMTRNPPKDGSNHWAEVSGYTEHELAEMEAKYNPPVHHTHTPVLDPRAY